MSHPDTAAAAAVAHGVVSPPPDPSFVPPPDGATAEPGGQPSEGRPARRSCVLIGEGAVLVACGDLLASRGLVIRGVVSDDETVIAWARRRAVPRASAAEDLGGLLRGWDHDYLLSIFNLRILPPAAIAAPRIAAINYHDGPLPRYAGLHAPSWALFHGESRYGISWHLVGQGIDTGDIVASRSFTVAADDTAQSLGARCGREAVAALADLLPALDRGALPCIPQDAAARTYYPGARRPRGAGIIDWTRPAAEIDALARGLDFGASFNPLGVPRIWLGDGFVVAARVHRGGEGTAAPGTVLAVDGDAFTIAAGSGTVVVGGITTPDGQPLAETGTRDQPPLRPGCRLPCPPPDLLDGVTARAESLAGHESFWERRLHEIVPLSLPLLALPGERERAPIRLAWRVPHDVEERLAGGRGAAGRQEFLLAACGGFLARLGFETEFDVELRDPAARAADPRGLFAAGVPFRFSIGDDLDPLLDAVRESLAAVAARATYARDLVVRSPRLAERASLRRATKLPVVIVLPPGDAGVATADGFTPGDPPQLVIRLPAAGAEGILECDPALVERVSSLPERLSRFLRDLAAGGGGSLRLASLATPDEIRVVRDAWGSGGPGAAPSRCVHELVEEWASRSPNAVAVVDSAGALTYGELDARAARLAARLRRRGVGADVSVGILVERSAAAIVGMLGILKAGGGYVPLDPAMPAERLAFIVADSGARFVVGAGDHDGRLSGCPAEWVDIQAAEETTDREAVAPPTAGPASLAYTIYTSGSTGRPKGVMVEHRSVVNFTHAARRRYRLGPGDRVLQFAALGFDASVEEIFPCLAAGATLVIRTDEMLGSAELFLKRCADAGITVLDLPTAYWHLLVGQMRDAAVRPPAGLRLVIIGGEQASAALVAAWEGVAGPAVELVNTYGPTEATVIATWADPRPASDGEVPIGVPLPGVVARVLDRWGQPVPPGVVGELYLGGACLARGYARLPEFTAERFRADPSAAGDAGRLYRTGDLCRWRPDGMLVFHGRIDGQVKVRGHRVEVGEIEEALQTLPGVRRAAVVPRTTRSGEVRLVAWLEHDEGGPPDDAIRSRLGLLLPGFMIPAAFQRLAALPLNPSGKIDRAALPALDAAAEALPSSAAPATPVEKVIAADWRDVLEGEASAAGVDDDFFLHGGTSLSAMELAGAISLSTGVQISLRDVFDRRTIARLATLVEERTAASPEAGPAAGPAALAAEAAGRPGDASQVFPATPAQRGMWLLWSILPDPATYNESVVFRTRQAVDWPRLREGFAAIMAGQPALRTAIALCDDALVQRILPAAAVDLPWAEREIPRAAAGDLDRVVGEFLRAEARRPFDLAVAPLWRATQAHAADGESLLLLTFHHSIIDDWSVRLLIEWLGNLSAGASAGHDAGGVVAVDAAATVWPALAEADAARHRRFWATKLRDPPDGPRWPDGRTRPPTPTSPWENSSRTSSRSESLRSSRMPRTRDRIPAIQQAVHPQPATGRGDVLAFEVDAATSRRLRALARAHGTTPFTVMLAAWHAWLRLATGEDDIVVGTPVADRVRPETQGVLGLCVNTLPVRVRWRDLAAASAAGKRAGGPGFGDVIDTVRDTFHEALAHADFPFEEIVRTAAGRRERCLQPLASVFFAYLDRPLPPLRVGGVSLRPAPVHTGTSKCDLTLYVVAADEAFDCRFEYATDIFDGATIAAHAERFVAFLRAAGGAAEAPLETLGIGGPEPWPPLSDHGHGPVVPLPQPACLVDIFRTHARRTPTAVAVACGEREMSYAELDGASDRLAAHLVSRLSAAAAGPCGFIGILLDRSIEFVVAVLGVLKAGCGYAPLPTDQPLERLGFMIGDARLAAVVTDRRLAGRLAGIAVDPVWMDADEPWWRSDPAGAECGPLPVRREGESPAYVMYTSGSTGTPKGVVVPHRAVVRLVHGQTYADFGPGLRTLLLAPTAFDASTFELWGPLLSGGTCVVFPDPLPELPRLAAVLREGAVNCLWLTAGLFNVVVDCAPETLATVAHVITGGEPLSVPHVRRALACLPRLRLTNGYGPTESTTFACTQAIGRHDPFACGSVPIGTPLANTSCRVVDESLRPVPPGAPGELVIGGAGLALGYLGRPDLTAERFVADPFAEGPGERLYRTGDICRQLADGSFEFLGRADGQVKIRGQRVETGEVEAVLGCHPDVLQAAVVVVERGGGAAGATKLLRGCVVPRPGTRVDVGGLRGFLATRLPEPMLPGEWLVRDALPLTANGKLDREAIRKATPDAVDAGGGVGRDAGVCAPGASGGEGTPESPLEREILTVWRRLFGRDDVGPADDFFAVGGDSLLAVRLAQELGRLLHRRVPIATVFDAPTPASLARWAAATPSSEQPRSAVPLAAGVGGAPLFLAHGIRGDIFHFTGLARLLADHAPVHGLQAVDRDGRYPPTLEELCAEYAAEIGRMAPTGSVVVGGYSLGGWVAFEVARQLVQSGRQITLLLFDVFPNCRVPRRTRPALRACEILAEMVSIAQRARLHARRVSGRPIRELPAAAAGLARPCARRVARLIGWKTFDKAAGEDAVAVPTADVPAPDPLFPLVAGYEARPFAVDAVLFRSGALASLPLPLFWRLLLGRRVRTYRLRQGHHHLFDAEGLPALAALVAEALPKRTT